MKGEQQTEQQIPAKDEKLSQDIEQTSPDLNKIDSQLSSLEQFRSDLQVKEETPEGPKYHFSSKKPYLNITDFEQLVEAIDSVGGESKIAQDAVIRIEQINREMEAKYNNCQKNMEAFEKGILKIDKLIYKGEEDG